MMSRLTATSAARWLCRGLVILTFVLLLATGALVALEHSWERPHWFQTKQAAFVAGSIGTEFVPLPVLEVLPVIDPKRFPPTEVDAKTQALKGGWVAQYGFLERRGADEPTFPPTDPELAEALKDGPARSLPVGFTVSYYRMFSPDPSPVAFVGLACAACHSARFPENDARGKLVYGAGNPRLDLIGFFEAYRGVLLEKKPKASIPPARTQDVSLTEGPDLDADDQEYVLSMASIEAARKDAKLPALSLSERGMICVWLLGARKGVEETKMRDDLPATPEQLRTPEYNGVGPGRTEPFVTLDHAVLRLPAIHNHGYSKIPAVFREGDRAWAQFDGSVFQPRTRSGLAAMTAGGSVDNLGGLGIARNIIAAAEYTVAELKGPRWADIFGAANAPGRPDEPADVEKSRLNETQLRGRAVYRRHCTSCHGQPDPAKPDVWSYSAETAPHYGKVIPAIDPYQYSREKWPSYWYDFGKDEKKGREHWHAQATDPARVDFRDSRIMPYTLFTYFDRKHPRKTTGEYYPLDHPLATPRNLIRSTGGYVAGALDSLPFRAPYLHNGSIPTLAQLINLDPRPDEFLRGANRYDRNKVGLVAPGPGKPTDGADLFWTFTVKQPGNSNAGHNYPWAYKDSDRNTKDLEDLLEYLKTL